MHKFTFDGSIDNIFKNAYYMSYKEMNKKCKCLTFKLFFIKKIFFIEIL